MNQKPFSSKGALLGLGLLLSLLGIGSAVYWFVSLRGQENTDDAYVAGNVIPLMPKVEGNVQAILAEDTQWVEAGAPLVLLDPTDAQLSLKLAQSRLAQAVRQMEEQQAQLVEREASVRLREAELVRLQGDLQRRSRLGMSQAVGQEEVLHANQSVEEGRAALAVAIAQRDAIKQKLHGLPVSQQPEVLQAAEQLRQAWLDLQRTRVLSPVSGVVAKRMVQVGSHVTAGTLMLAVVPLDSLWVDANFKESQLARVRIGQPVTLSADLYGEKVTYHGKVAGLAAGTGSVFSLLPAQNATGNWLKVVQRLPVRIDLDAAELKAHPLRLGLSMQVGVDVSDTRGPTLTRADAAAAAALPASLPQLQPADRMVADIISQNSTHG